MKDTKRIIDDEKLMSQWNWDKNNLCGIFPEKEPLNSRKKIWWVCEKGHEWAAVAYHRARGTGCPYCYGRLAVSGENDLETLRPDLMKEWDWDKNSAAGIFPNKLKVTSNTRVWWMCSKCKNSYDSMLASRTYENCNCPYCSGVRILPGFNDFKTIYPNIAKDWDYELNGEMLPQSIAPKTNRKYWWRCKMGHSYYMSVENRVKGCDCNYCSGNKVLAGFNDLATTNPDLIEEWDFEKNEILPTQITSGSHKNVWWKCSNGHSWFATVKNRANGAGCKMCFQERHSSFAERAIYYYTSRFFPDAIWNYETKELGRFEIDIFIPSIRVGIEYDGQKWHKDTIRDIKKDKLCLKNHIRLIRVREPECENYESASKFIYLKDLSHNSLKDAIIEMLIDIGIDNPIISIEKDFIDIENLVRLKTQEKSIANLFPEIAQWWDFDKNGSLTPDKVTYGSHKIVWWKCPKGHSYRYNIKDKVQKRVGRPCCREENKKQKLKGDK